MLLSYVESRSDRSDGSASGPGLGMLLFEQQQEEEEQQKQESTSSGCSIIMSSSGSRSNSGLVDDAMEVASCRRLQNRRRDRAR